MTRVHPRPTATIDAPASPAWNCSLRHGYQRRVAAGNRQRGHRYVLGACTDAASPRAYPSPTNARGPGQRRNAGTVGIRAQASRRGRPRSADRGPRDQDARRSRPSCNPRPGAHQSLGAPMLDRTKCKQPLPSLPTNARAKKRNPPSFGRFRPATEAAYDRFSVMLGPTLFVVPRHVHSAIRTPFTAPIRTRSSGGFART